MFSNIHGILADGAGAPYSLLCPPRYAKEKMHRMTTTHTKYTIIFLHQALDFSKGVDAGVGDCLNISERKPFAEQFDFALVLLQHLLLALAITFLATHLAAKAAVMVIPTFHATADE